MYTAYANYFATGEGVTLMVMFSRGYGPNHDPHENVKEKFFNIFGKYMGLGVEIFDGLKLDLPDIELLVSLELQKRLEHLVNEAGGLEYYASLHVNLS